MSRVTTLDVDPNFVSLDKTQCIAYMAQVIVALANCGCTTNAIVGSHPDDWVVRTDWMIPDGTVVTIEGRGATEDAAYQMAAKQMFRNRHITGRPVHAIT